MLVPGSLQGFLSKFLFKASVCGCRLGFWFASGVSRTSRVLELRVCRFGLRLLYLECGTLSISNMLAAIKHAKIP